MAYTLKLDTFSHDLTIKNGKFVRVNGADEVRQRIKVALWHHYNEYFLNRGNGLPYYDYGAGHTHIMGSKLSQQTLHNMLRNKILSVPGVLRLVDSEITRLGRQYLYSCKVAVQKGPGDPKGDTIWIQGLSIGG